MTVLVGVMLIAGGIAAPPAFAHAALKSSTPRAGETVDEPPSQVRLTFTQDIEPTSARIEVIDPDGARVDDGTATADGETVTIPLEPSLRPGRYTVAFRIVSLDGHPVEDDFRFTLAAPAEPSPAPTPSPSPTSAPNVASDVPSRSAGDASPRAVPAAPTAATGNGPWPALLGLALLAAILGAGAYMIVRRRTGAS